MFYRCVCVCVRLNKLIFKSSFSYGLDYIQTLTQSLHSAAAPEDQHEQTEKFLCSPCHQTVQLQSWRERRGWGRIG
uniref:Uncharacterized protein n=1 Tax=Anguilla anguilla TaxID=7936 RepID=A0A0E9X1R7_ANGAN